MPIALITGVTGQDGSYLSELLLEKGYEVHGLLRPTSLPERSRVGHLANSSADDEQRFFLHAADLSDPPSLRRILLKTVPDEIYHLAGQSHPRLSFDMVESTCDVTAMGTVRLLEIVRDLPNAPRFFHASSSEIFGRPESRPQDEQTPFRPVTPYGCAKAFATQLVSVYRQTFGLFACSGILYNHESPRRGENFVTQKICRAAAAIKCGLQKELLMGSLDAQRDWGDAREYVQAMWLMLQQQKPADFVLATRELHSVQEVVEIAFETVGLDWRQHVKQDPRFMRPDEPSQLVGNPAKARQLLNWQARTDFKELIAGMTKAALEGTAASRSDRG